MATSSPWSIHPSMSGNPASTLKSLAYSIFSGARFGVAPPVWKISVHGRGGDLDRQAVRRSGVGGGGPPDRRATVELQGFNHGRERDPMTEERLALSELLEKAGDSDFLRTVAEAVLQLLMETDVEGLIGAGRYERSGERTTWRNGHRDRVLDTRLGIASAAHPEAASGELLRRSWRRGRSPRRR